MNLENFKNINKVSASVALLSASLIAFTSWNVVSALSMQVKDTSPKSVDNKINLGNSKVEFIKAKLNSIGVYFNKGKLISVNNHTKPFTIYVEGKKYTLNKSDYVELKLKDNGEILVNGTEQISFDYKIVNNQVEVIDVNDKSVSDFKTNKIASVSHLSEKQQKVTLHNEKQQSASSLPSLASAQPAATTTSKSSSVSSPSASTASADNKVSSTDATSEARKVWLHICDFLDLGSIKALLSTGQTEAVQSAKKLSSNGKEVYFITSQTGYGAVGVKRSDLMQASSLNISGMKLNLDKAVSQAGYNRLVIDPLHTVLYKGNISEDEVSQMVGGM